MAIFRKIHTQLWSDPFFSELDSEKKLFYIYLLTNEKTKQCGIYEIAKKQIAYDLNLSLEKVNKLLNFFISKGKIQFSENTNELAIRNWKKYNYSTSPKVVKCIESELKLVKNKVLIEYIYSIYTVSQEEQEQEQEEEEEQEQELKKPKKQIPTLDEFSNYVLTVPEFQLKLESLRYSIQSKYEQWIDNGWKDGHGNEIKNWKTKLKNTLPHLKAINNNGNGITNKQTMDERLAAAVKRLNSAGGEQMQSFGGGAESFSDFEVI